MSSLGKWLATAVISIGAFILTWWAFLLLGQPTDVALAVAGAVTGVALAPLAWWAGRERESRKPSAQALQGVSGGITIGARSIVAIHGTQNAIPSPAPASDGGPEVNLNDLSISLMNRIIGRNAELDRLRVQLTDEDVSVVALTGFGGAGKSALVEAFLAGIAPGYEGARRVFGWHFYSQEERSSIVSNASLFWEQALRFFGYRGDLPVYEGEKAYELARQLNEQRVILVLDGIEALQNPPHINDGVLADKAVQSFLVSIARDGLHNGGLVVITSRQPVTELGQFERARSIELGPLNPESGLELLRATGVKGLDADLRRTVKDYRGHPLSLILLAKILASDYNGDILQRLNIEYFGTHIQDNVNAILDYYGRAFGEHDPELIYLYFVSIVRRALSGQELAELVAKSVIGETLRGLPEARINHAVSCLERYGLIISDNDYYDAHALIRSYFSERFRRSRESEFIQAHDVLYNYFAGLPGEWQPSGMEALEPLYRSVYHGCMAGRYADALLVYWERISRERAFYSQKEIGAFSSDLSAIVPFFANGWDRPVADGLSDEQSAWLLGLAAFLLTGLGRLGEALKPRYAGIRLSESLGDQRMACSDLRNLVTLLIPLGRISEALDASERAIRLVGEFASSIRDGEFSSELNDIELDVSALVRKAAVLRLYGRMEEARDLFDRAERAQGSILNRINGFFYGQFLADIAVSEDDLRDVIRRAIDNLRVAEQRRNLGDRAHAELILGIVYAKMGATTQAAEHLDLAVDTLRQANRVDRLPVALMERARLYHNEWLRSASEAAKRLFRSDLDEAYQQISFSRMSLLDIDYQILRANILADSGERMLALDLVRDNILPNIETIGYNLRIAEVNELTRRLDGV